MEPDTYVPTFKLDNPDVLTVIAGVCRLIVRLTTDDHAIFKGLLRKVIVYCTVGAVFMLGEKVMSLDIAAVAAFGIE